MLMRVLHTIFALCPVTVGAGVGWAAGPGWGVAVLGASTFGYVLVLFTVDVFPEPASANREISR